MEQQHENPDSSIFNMSIDPQLLNYLSDAAKWGKFLAVIGFIMCGFLLLLGIAMPALFSRMNTYNQTNLFNGSSMGGLLFFVYLVIALIYFFPCLFLLRFSNAAKAAVISNDQFKLTESFKNLKALLKYVGIVTIVILSLYALAIVFGSFSALTR